MCLGWKSKIYRKKYYVSRLPCPTSLTPRSGELLFLFHPQANPLDPTQTGERLPHTIQQRLLADRGLLFLLVLVQCIQVIRIICRLPSQQRGGCINSILAICNALRDAHSDAVGRLAKQRPQQAHITPGEGGHDIHRRIAQTDGEDLGLGRYTEKGVAQGQDAATVGGGTFWEQDNRPVGVLLDQGRDIHHPGTRCRLRGGESESSQNGLEQRDALDLASVGIGRCEDRVEDSC